MQGATTAVKTRLAHLSKYPVYIIEFGKMNDSDSTNSIPPIRFATSYFKNPTGPYYRLLQSVKGAGAVVTIIEGTRSISQLDFIVLDSAKKITKYLQTFVFNNRQVTVKMGFPDIDEADFVPIFSGRILGYQLQSDNISWKFNARDTYADAFRDIMTKSAKTTVYLYSTFDNVVHVNSWRPTLPADGFRYKGFAIGWLVGFSSYDVHPSSAGNNYFLRIDDEIMGFEDLAAIVPPPYTEIADRMYADISAHRGLYGTGAVDHAIGSPVSGVFFLQGNPITVALQILMSTGTARKPSGKWIDGVNGKYDVLPLSCGLGISPSLIDIEGFERERDKWIPNLNIRVLIEGAMDAKQFIEKELFSIVGAYPKVLNDGRMSLKIFAPPNPLTQARTITDDVLVGAPVWTGNLFDKNFYNELDISLDFNPGTGQYQTRVFYEDSTSQVIYNKVSTLTIESKALRSDFPEGLATVDRIADRLFKRFANPAPVISAKVFMTEALTEAGDVVILKSDKIRELARGISGSTGAYMEVMQRDPDFDTGQFTLLLANTGYSYGRRYGVISPSRQAPTNFPTYTLATDVQRRYGFISRKIDTTLGVMSDGSDGYYITP